MEKINLKGFGSYRTMDIGEMKMNKKRRIIFIMLILTMTLLLISCKGKKNEEAKININLFPAYKVDKNQRLYGYIDSSGKFKVEAKYTTANRFTEEGLALVEKDGLLGVVDIKGKEILGPEYSKISNFKNGYFIAFKDGKNIIVSSKGEKTQIENNYISIGDYSNGMFTVFNIDSNTGMKVGYINEKGEVIIKPRYNMAYEFYNDKAYVQEKENTNFKIIDKKGGLLKEVDYKELKPSNHPGEYIFKGRTNRYGLIDHKGDLIVKDNYSVIERVNSDYVVYGLGEIGSEKYGLLDKKGNVKLEANYLDIKLLGDGYVGVSDGKNPLGYKEYSILGPNMKAINGDHYILLGGSSGEFQGDYLSVSDGEKTFLIDKKGNLASKYPEQLGIGEIVVYGEVAMVNIGDETLYYDSKGDLLWEGSTSYTINDSVSIETEKYRADKSVDIYYPKIVGLENKNVESSINSNLERNFILDGHKDYKYYKTRFNTSYNAEIVTIEKITNIIYGDSGEERVLKQVYNFNIRDGKFYRLKDIFKEEVDYIPILNDIIIGKIQAIDETYPISNFEGISEDQSFKVNKTTIDIYIESSLGPNIGIFENISIERAELEEVLNLDSELLKRAK